MSPLEAVKLLVEAGATLDAKDNIYDGTPLDWAEYGEHAQIQRNTFRRGTRTGRAVGVCSKR
jgi:peptide-methionine (S)-S-oxide reductase